MLRSIFAIALSCSLFICINTAVQAAVSPIPILIVQCLQLSSPITQGNLNIAETSDIADPLIESYKLEKALLGLFNIKDRLQYYRGFALNSVNLERLLKCQLHLADIMSETLNSAMVSRLALSLKQSEEAELQQLSIRINTLIKDKTNQKIKSQLYTAQANVKQGLRSQNLTLNFDGTNCVLPNNKNQEDSKDANFHLSIASYLIRQNDAHCQQLVWQAYQSRAKDKNTQALMRIANIKQEIAAQAGFVDHSDFALSNQFLSSPQLVALFLDAATKAINTPPWEIGRELAASVKSPVQSTTSSAFIQLIYNKANKLGFTFEIVTEHIHRVWYHGRLLGDVYFNQEQRTRSQKLRVPVQGFQFGQIQINTKAQLTSYWDKQAIVSAMAIALSQLSASSHYYLINTLGETSDTSLLGQHWLEYFLSDGILEPKAVGSREDKIAKYSTQLKVFRAKVALDFYRNSESKLYQDLTLEFRKAFGQPWDQPDNHPYSFLAITDIGPLYYQAIWQEALANLIYQSTRGCQSQQNIFELLLVNEDSLSLNKRLATLLNQPVDPVSLIKRIQDASNVEDKHSLTCTL
jgi:hypothetical protein